MDGYDKLKPFGFPIHGAIDGYSRRIIWLEVGASNNNPFVISSYYLNALVQNKVAPSVLRCDLGKENVHLEYLQPFFARDVDGPFAGENSFLYGKSTSNQRIESWWGILRRQGGEFWLSLFKDMRDSGALHTHNSQHIMALRFAFLNLIRDDLNKISIEWNRHRTEAEANAEGPRGKPDILYFLPELSGSRD